jgi:polyisoprenoid-binding protein YceI
MKTLKIAVLLFFTSAMLTFAQTNWTFDKAHSKIGFSVSHLVITDVEGNFKEFDASVTTDGDNWENAKIEFTAEIASIDTDNEKRDEHLRSDDFFNAEMYPQLKFVSKSFNKVDGNEYKLVGDLTIRDVTKEVELEVELNGTVVDPWGNTKAGFDLEGEINRFDYGLKWSKALETGGLVVGEDVEIIGKLQLMKK